VENSTALVLFQKPQQVSIIVLVTEFSLLIGGFDTGFALLNHRFV